MDKILVSRDVPDIEVKTETFIETFDQFIYSLVAFNSSLFKFFFHRCSLS